MKRKNNNVFNVLWCILMASTVYFITTYVTMFFNDNSEQYNVLNHIYELSDEQMLYIAINELAIGDFQADVKYIGHTQRSRFGCTIFYVEKIDDVTIKQYYYNYEDSLGYGAFSDSYDIVVWYDTYSKVKGESGEQYKEYEIDNEFYMLEEEFSEKEYKRVALPEDWDYRVEKTIWGKRWWGIFVIRLVAVLLVSLISIFKIRFNKENSIKMNFLLVSKVVLFFCYTDCVIRAGIYTTNYLKSHTAVIGGMGVPFKWRIPFEFIGSLLLENIYFTFLLCSFSIYYMVTIFRYIRIRSK